MFSFEKEDYEDEGEYTFVFRLCGTTELVEFDGNRRIDGWDALEANYPDTYHRYFLAGRADRLDKLDRDPRSMNVLAEHPLARDR